MAEIADARKAQLEQTEAFLKALYDDSAVGMRFRKLVKEKFPNATLPELDAVTAAEKTGEDLKKQFDELSKGTADKIDKFLSDRQKEKEDAQVADYQARFDKIVKDRGYTEDGQKKLIELMKGKGIRDPEDAAILFESTLPKEKIAPRQFNSRMPFVSPDGKEDESFKRLMEDPDQWAADEMYAALAGTNQE